MLILDVNEKYATLYQYQPLYEADIECFCTVLYSTAVMAALYGSHMLVSS